MIFKQNITYMSGRKYNEINEKELYLMAQKLMSLISIVHVIVQSPLTQYCCEFKS